MSGFYWLASYPKSGNTWVRLFLESLSLGGLDVDINKLSLEHDHCASRHAFDWILDISSTDLTDSEIACLRPRLYELEAQKAKQPVISKVHDRWGTHPMASRFFR
jgi:aryl sulfotransferase